MPKQQTAALVTRLQRKLSDANLIIQGLAGLYRGDRSYIHISSDGSFSVTHNNVSRRSIPCWMPLKTGKDGAPVLTKEARAVLLSARKNRKFWWEVFDCLRTDPLRTVRAIFYELCREDHDEPHRLAELHAAYVEYLEEPWPGEGRNAAKARREAKVSYNAMLKKARAVKGGSSVGQNGHMEETTLASV